MHHNSGQKLKFCLKYEDQPEVWLWRACSHAMQWQITVHFSLQFIVATSGPIAMHHQEGEEMHFTIYKILGDGFMIQNEYWWLVTHILLKKCPMIWSPSSSNNGIQLRMIWMLSLEEMPVKRHTNWQKLKVCLQQPNEHWELRSIWYLWIMYDQNIPLSSKMPGTD